MTLDEAIETLTDEKNQLDPVASSNHIAALKLGIEALLFFKEFQRVTGSHQDARLPSETK